MKWGGAARRGHPELIASRPTPCCFAPFTGTLSDANSDGVHDTITTAATSQSWSLDAMGNFASQTTDGTAVSRTHNKQNEITAVGSARTQKRCQDPIPESGPDTWYVV